MKRFLKILFISDGSKGEQLALSRILELAQLNKASVTVMGVIATPSKEISSWDPRFYSPELLIALRKKREKELKNLLAAAKPKGSRLKTGVMVKDGTVYIEIIKTVQSEGYDLLAKANHNDSRLKGMFFGALDMQLLRKCPCPVYIVNSSKKIRHSRVVAAVDLIRTTKKLSNLDRMVMDLATSIATIEEGTLDVVHAWHLPHENLIKNEEKFEFYKSVATMRKEWRQTEKTNLEILGKDYAEFNPQLHLIKGEPDSVIPRFVKSKRADLIVMGTISRTGIAGFFIGNTAESILNSINCSILAIKPEGYKSPVK